MQKFKSLQELFEDEKRWTKGEYARDEKGFRVDSNSKEAVCWCLSGACSAVYRHAGLAIWIKLSRSLPNNEVVAWNDDPARTIDDVRRLVKEAGV